MEDLIFIQDIKLNKYISGIVNNLRDELIFNFHPKSIILTGSFGRGEATVTKSGSNIKFLSDCEVIIIPNRHIFDQEIIRTFCSNFYHKTNLEIALSGVLVSIYLSSPFLSGCLKPTIGNYDLKYGSKVIYGINYLDRIPCFEPGDIPAWEGIRLMINRMAEALDHFSIDNPGEDMFFWTNKIILACQDALLISSNNYHPSYRTRNQLFKQIYVSNFNNLYDKIPNFLPLTIKATNYKLSHCSRYHDDLIKFWFEVSEIANIIFRYMIEIEMGIKFDSYIEFQQKYLNHHLLKSSYYRGLSPNPIYQNIMSMIRLYTLNKIKPPCSLFNKILIPWNHIIYSSIPILYFNLTKQGTVEENSLNKLNDVLYSFSFTSEAKCNSFQKIYYTKNLFIQLWKILCY